MASRGKSKDPKSSDTATFDFVYVEEKATESKALSMGLETRHMPPSNAVAKLSIKPNARTFIVRMTRSATLTTGGGGTLSLITTIGPAQMDQYSSQFASLFREARLRKTRITYTSLTGTSPTTPFAFDSVFDPSANTGSVAPSNAWRFENCKRFAAHSIMKMVNTAILPNRPYSLIDATAAGTDPVGGLEGAWCHCAATTPPASTAVLTYLIETWYEIRFMR